MAKFPKVIHGPVFNEDKLVWNCTAVAVTPCRVTINRSSEAKSQSSAKTKAENLCDAGIKRHMNNCNDCPEHVKKKYR